MCLWLQNMSVKRMRGIRILFADTERNVTTQVGAHLE